MTSQTLPDIDALAARISGHALPGGTIAFPAHHVWLGNDAMDAGGSSDQMNPLWFLVACLRGMGTTIGELVEIAETNMDEGVLFGEMTIEQGRPLQAGITYRVTGEINSIVRREGRSGVFDVLEFSLDVGDEGVRNGRVTCSFVLQRRAA